MNKTFATALTLACLSAASNSILPPRSEPYYGFSPNVLASWSWDVGHEICSRSVDRLLKQNTDFNKALEDTPQGSSWTDTVFTGDDRIFWKDYRPTDKDDDISDHVDRIEWKRLKDVFSDDKYSMWGSKGISFADPMQGQMGNCWLIAAASVSAQEPERIKEIFEIEHLNEAGVYAVQLYIMGIPVTVTVDDYLPFHKNTDSLIYSSEGPDNALWMPILEKASAKAYGSYEFLEGGHIGAAV